MGLSENITRAALLFGLATHGAFDQVGIVQSDKARTKQRYTGSGTRSRAQNKKRKRLRAIVKNSKRQNRK